MRGQMQRCRPRRHRCGGENRMEELRKCSGSQVKRPARAIHWKMSAGVSGSQGFSLQ